MTPELLRERFQKIAQTEVDFLSLRYVRTLSENLEMRQNVLTPPIVSHDEGVMLMVHNTGGLGYAATSDLSDAGLSKAFKLALNWANNSAAFALTDFSLIEMPANKGVYKGRVLLPWDKIAL